MLLIISKRCKFVGKIITEKPYKEKAILLFYLGALNICN